MNNELRELLSLSSATGRWSRIGPYYAMFPVDFAFEVVAEYSRPGDAVLDPFAGRASSIYAAAALGREGCGIEINPVGWLYGHVKLRPADEGEVIARLRGVCQSSKSIRGEVLDCLPSFFRSCFAPEVLRFLIAARAALNWRSNAADATLMALLLVYLHGKREESLSNQMRQGKAMSPDYALRWWADREMPPPMVDPYEFMRQRVEWRYMKGLPEVGRAQVMLGDCLSHLPTIRQAVCAGLTRPFSLVFTSPPYCGVTDYHYDQWLRIWLLGGRPWPTKPPGPSQGRFVSRDHYERLLHSTFAGLAPTLDDNAVIYVRTDAREFTYETTTKILRMLFPRKHILRIARPFLRRTQTALFGDATPKPGEVDIILTP
jgi:hypothetical protein